MFILVSWPFVSLPALRPSLDARAAGCSACPDVLRGAGDLRASPVEWSLAAPSTRLALGTRRGRPEDSGPRPP